MYEDLTMVLLLNIYTKCLKFVRASDVKSFMQKYVAS